MSKLSIFEKWSQLSSRERWMIVGGAIFSVVLLIYVFIWSPLQSGIYQAESQLQTQTRILIWLQHASVEVQRYRYAGIQQLQQLRQPLLVFAEKTLAQQKLSQYLNQVQQPQAKQLQLTFNSVPFDKLMQWLQLLWQQGEVDVTSVQIQKMSTEGLVKAEITL